MCSKEYCVAHHLLSCSGLTLARLEIDDVPAFNPHTCITDHSLVSDVFSSIGHLVSVRFCGGNAVEVRVHMDTFLFSRQRVEHEGIRSGGWLDEMQKQGPRWPPMVTPIDWSVNRGLGSAVVDGGLQRTSLMVPKVLGSSVAR